MTERPTIVMPDLCLTHQRLLLSQARYGPMDPWRALLICVQIALFQAVTCDDTAYDKAGGDVANLARLGCFACFKPDRFGELVEAAKTHDLGVIKRLGESWVEAKRAP